MRDSAVVYKTLWDKFEMLKRGNQEELGKDVVVAAVYKALSGEDYTDDVLVNAMLTELSFMFDKNEVKYQNKTDVDLKEQQLREIADLYNQGYTQRQIADMIGNITQQGVSRRVKKIKEQYPYLLDEGMGEESYVERDDDIFTTDTTKFTTNTTDTTKFTTNTTDTTNTTGVQQIQQAGCTTNTTNTTGLQQNRTTNTTKFTTNTTVQQIQQIQRNDNDNVNDNVVFESVVFLDHFGHEFSGQEILDAFNRDPVPWESMVESFPELEPYKDKFYPEAEVTVDENGQFIF